MQPSSEDVDDDDPWTVEVDRPGPPDFFVHPDNWDAVLAFLELQTQWRVIAGMGGVLYQGLDYACVGAYLEIECPSAARRRELFRQIRLIESGAVSVINGRQDVSDNAANSR